MKTVSLYTMGTIVLIGLMAHTHPNHYACENSFIRTEKCSTFFFPTVYVLYTNAINPSHFPQPTIYTLEPSILYGLDLALYIMTYFCVSVAHTVMLYVTKLQCTFFLKFFFF